MTENVQSEAHPSYRALERVQGDPELQQDGHADCTPPRNARFVKVPHRDRSVMRSVAYGGIVGVAAAIVVFLVVRRSLPSIDFTEGSELEQLSGTRPWCSTSGDLPHLWRYDGPVNLQARVLTYNLFWWNLYGKRDGANNIASKLIADADQSVPFDFMGFQECEDPVRVLNAAGLQGQYEVKHGKNNICLAYRTAAWQWLGYGISDVAEDRHDQYYGTRSAQWLRVRDIKTGATVFVVNHHGPLPLNSGGVCGGMAVTYHLLRLIEQHAERGDAVILIGDFNANGASLTLLEMEKRMYRVFRGPSFGGVDNVFSNIGGPHVNKTLDLGNGGSDHDALSVLYQVQAGPQDQVGSIMPPPHFESERCGAGHVLEGVELKIQNTFSVKSHDGRFVVAKPSGTVSASTLHSDTWGQFKIVHHENNSVSFMDFHGQYLGFLDNTVTAMRHKPSSQTAFTQVPNHDGTVSFKSNHGYFAVVREDGAIRAIANISATDLPDEAKFWVTPNNWMSSVEYVPDAQMCCTLCKKTGGCKVWTWKNNALNEDLDGSSSGALVPRVLSSPAQQNGRPWPTQCEMKGGGAIYSVARPGVVSGFQSEHAYQEWHADHLQSSEKILADRLGERRSRKDDETEHSGNAKDDNNDQTEQETHTLDQAARKKQTQPHMTAPPSHDTRAHTQVRVLKDLRWVINSVPNVFSTQ